MEKIDIGMLPYAPVIVKLLQGAVYYEDKLWDELILNQIQIDRFFRQIGIELIMEEKDGYAFLRQKEDEEGKTIGLIRRMPLTYEQTLCFVCCFGNGWMNLKSRIRKHGICTLHINNSENESKYFLKKNQIRLNC